MWAECGRRTIVRPDRATSPVAGRARGVQEREAGVTDGLALLAAWVQFLLLLGVLAWFLLRRSP